MRITNSKILLLAATVVLLTSCASDRTAAVDTKSLYVEEIEQWLATADVSSWGQQILADHWVTDQEMRESIDRYTSCIAEVGILIDGEYEYSGGTQLIMPLTVNSPPEDFEKVEGHEQECARNFLSSAEIWYQQPRINPQNLDMMQGYLDCYIREGVVPAGTDQETVNSPNWQPPVDKEEAATRCLENPFGIEDLPWE